MEEVNLQAGRPFEDLPVPWLSPQEFARRSANGTLIDTRDVEAYAGGGTSPAPTAFGSTAWPAMGAG